MEERKIPLKNFLEENFLDFSDEQLEYINYDKIESTKLFGVPGGGTSSQNNSKMTFFKVKPSASLKE